ncbi:protein of unknown function [Pseudodesulfovibrio profundus]|uniref:Phage tail fibre protein N-terminal domain-containing protein n=1 Tax=Pseudodesulfovibrio profundus TaxID=57320 RepID=A0A2C8FED0_9BACT|nr:phage tail protein [Pseudodesulfovibrio profundus]SOB60526.1 protein of unknown function [Pseudodesulfovibrio profundus]
MSSAITNAGEALLALHQNLETPLVIDKFIVANVPGLDPTVPVDRTEGKPGAEYVVHEYTIPAENKGYINPNQVVYSMLLGSDIGDFDFNWIGLYSSADDAVIAITYCPTLNKKKTAHPVMGNAITRNFMLEYSGVQDVTNITVEAATWQIDFTARLKGIDERERLSNRDIYGPACFFGDGYLVIDDAGAFKLQPGLAYVEGIRIKLDAAQEITPPALPAEVFLDVALQSQGSDRVAVASVVYADPGDYMDGTNGNHFGQKIAAIAADRTATDLRPMGGEPARQDHAHPEKSDVGHTHTQEEIAGLVMAEIGELRLMPFRAEHLPPGWYVGNGDQYADDSAQGGALLSLSAEYRADWGISLAGGLINVPNLFDVDGNGYFLRPVDGVARQIGSIQGDAIREIKGSITTNFSDLLFNSSSGALSVEPLGTGGNGLATGNGHDSTVNFKASDAVPTASENRPINIGLTPAIYLGV